MHHRGVGAWENLGSGIWNLESGVRGLGAGILIPDLTSDSAPNQVRTVLYCTFERLFRVPVPDSLASPTGRWVDPSTRRLCETLAKRICR